LKRIVSILITIIAAVNLQAQVTQNVCSDTLAHRYTIKGSPGMTFKWHVPKVAKVINSDTLNDTIWIVWPKISGTYPLSVTGDLNGCIVTKNISVKVNPGPVVDLGADASFCQGQHLPPYEIDSAKYSVLWSDGHNLHSTLHTYIPDTTQTFWVTVTNSDGCSASDTVNVTMNLLPKIKLPKDTILCGTGKLELDAGNPGSQYYWHYTGVTNTMDTAFYTQKISVDKGAKTITVVVTNSFSCKGYDTINILACNIIFNGIPSGFTPGHVGPNAKWEIQGLSEKYPNVVIEVYDRWGRLVFRSARGYPTPWDGNIDSGPLPTDTYFYIVDFYGNGKTTQNGRVTIIR
jgi:gliding motility-associated-like protein